jgi:hypothetical protein
MSLRSAILSAVKPYEGAGLLYNLKQALGGPARAFDAVELTEARLNGANLIRPDCCDVAYHGMYP